MKPVKEVGKRELAIVNRDEERGRLERSLLEWSVRSPQAPPRSLSLPSPFTGASQGPGMICTLDSASVAPYSLTVPSKDYLFSLF